MGHPEARGPMMQHWLFDAVFHLYLLKVLRSLLFALGFRSHRVYFCCSQLSASVRVFHRGFQNEKTDEALLGGTVIPYPCKSGGIS